MLVRVVHACFCIRQRCFKCPRIWQHAKSFVNQTLVPQSLKRPHHTFHVRHVECFVIVSKVDPTRLASYITLPVTCVTQHRFFAVVVKFLDTKIGDCLPSRNFQLTLCFCFRGQTMTIPAETSLNSLTLHRLISRNSVFDKPCEQVTVVRQTVGKRRSVIKHIFVYAVGTSVSLIDGSLKCVIGSPEFKRLVLDCRKVRLRINLWISHGASL